MHKLSIEQSVTVRQSFDLKKAFDMASPDLPSSDIPKALLAHMLEIAEKNTLHLNRCIRRFLLSVMCKA